VLLKYGVPPKLVRVLIAMHKTVLVKFDVDGVTQTLLSIIGVKQGDLLGPPLFVVYICAIMETWRSEHSYPLCAFRSRADFKLTGRRPTTAGEEFAIVDSEYADDTGLPFETRTDVEEQTPKVLVHFERWGMEVHAGIVETDARPRKESKSEVLFCAKPLRMYEDASTYDGVDLSDVLLPGGLFVNIVSCFPYLGKKISRSGSDRLRGRDSLDTLVRLRELATHGDGAAAAALLSCALCACDVSRHPRAHTRAAHLHL